MFTGIIETIGTVRSIERIGNNICFELTANFVSELKVDQSIAHNGCCLSVTSITDESYKVTAIAETLDKTNLSDWLINTQVNLERSLKLGDRLDGHIVQGHIDTVAICTSIEEQNGSVKFTFSHSSDHIVVEKGSIALNGVSLTVAEVQDFSFAVYIIPLTYEMTIFRFLKIGDKVNVEFDLMGKYITQFLRRKKR